MKKVFILAALMLVTGCMAAKQEVPTQQVVIKEVFPYNMTEKEWNDLSIKDKTRLRRDFYFYEKGQMEFVNPKLDVDGKPAEPTSWNKN